MAIRYFTVVKPSFIADQLVAVGSRITDAFLNGAEPGSNLVETNENGEPVNPDELAKLLAIGAPTGPRTIAPIMPHAPNPIHPQALLGQQAGGVQLAGN